MAGEGKGFIRKIMGCSSEKGSMTLMGAWLMGFLLLVSAMLFVYSNQEIRVSNLERESYYRQLMAESLLEKQQLLLRQDFGQVEQVLARNAYSAMLLSEGEEGKYLYGIRAMHDEAGKILLGVVVKDKEDPRADNIFSLRWHLEVDRDEKTVERCGIG